MEDQSIKGLEGCIQERILAADFEDLWIAVIRTQSVLLLNQSLEQIVGRADAVQFLGSLGSCDLAQPLDGHTRVDGGNGDPRQHGREDLSFPQCAGARAGQREEEALEETTGLVECLLQALEEMNVELLGLVDVLAEAVKNNLAHKGLEHYFLRRGKDSSSLVAVSS